MPAAPPGTNAHGQPWVEITEQPSSKSTRFRYECEGRFAGSILGKSSTNERKTFPSIKVHNHNGACVVVVSLVTHDDDKPKPHPHTLVGPECRQGVCTKKVKQNLDCIQFPNLGIQCKKKAELRDALTLRQQIRVDPYRTGFDHMEKPQLNSINLMVVRLCFQVFLPDESGKYQRPLSPVCSDPIQDKKSAGELSIHSYLPESCPIAGREEMILLTGKLPKADDLEVRFYEGRPEQPEWEGFATFTQKDIHQSVALTIKVPEYTKTLPQQPRHKINVMMELRKKSNHADRSQSRRFVYLLGDSRNRFRVNKREHEGVAYSQSAKKMKNESDYRNQQCLNNDEANQAPTVLEGFSIETNSSGGSAFNSTNSNYQMNTTNMYSQQNPQPTQLFQPYSNGIQQQQHMQPPNQPQYAQMEPAQSYYQQPQHPDVIGNGVFSLAPGPDKIKIRASDINIYRSDDSGKVFMAPGPTAPNPNAPKFEVRDEDFANAELSIEEILKLAKDNPDSEIYIPSNFSEHLNNILNSTITTLDGEVVLTSAIEEEEQLDTTSLTRELKDLPQAQGQA